MPKVTINDSQGLIQSSGSGVEFNSVVSGLGSSILSGFAKDVSVLSTGTTLTAADSGKVFLLVQGTSAKTATLPVAASGLNFRFVLKTAHATYKWEIVQASSADDFVGHIAASAAAGATASGSNTLIKFVNNVSVPGDYVALECDGTNWYVSGMAAATGGVIFV